MDFLVPSMASYAALRIYSAMLKSRNSRLTEFEKAGKNYYLNSPQPCHRI